MRHEEQRHVNCRHLVGHQRGNNRGKKRRINHRSRDKMILNLVSDEL